MLVTDKSVPSYTKNSWTDTRNQWDEGQDCSHKPNLCRVQPSASFFAVIWARLLLRLYLEGSRSNVRTDHYSVACVLNLGHATKNLTQRRLWLSEYRFDLVQRPGVKFQADHDLSRLKKDEVEGSVVDDDTPVLAAEQNMPVSRCKPEDDNLVCTLCNDRVHHLQVTMIAVVNETTSNPNGPPSVLNFIGEQSMDGFCKTSAASVGMLSSHFSIGWPGLLILQPSMDRALQKVLSDSLQARILHFSHHPVLSNNPKHRWMYDTLHLD